MDSTFKVGPILINSMEVKYKIHTKVILYLLLILVTVVVLFPFFWVFLTSLKKATDITSYPPKFFFDIALESVDKLIAGKPQKLCYGHYGMADDAAKMLQNHRRQLFDWKTIIGEEIKQSDAEDLIEACVKRLLKEDSLLANFHNLSEDVQEREKYFLENSIRGFAGYLQSE